MRKSQETLNKIKRLIISLVGKVYPVDKHKVLLINERYSGSNVLALYKYAPEYVRKKWRISLLDLSTITFKDSFSNIRINFKSIIGMVTELSRSKIIVTDHGSRKIKRSQININTWHGFPIKAMGKMALESAYLKMKRVPNVDYNISYSQLYNVLISACFGYDIKTFKILGAPRNDFLFRENAKNNIREFLNINLNSEKLILFMPTFREGYRGIEGKRKTNIFGLTEFNFQEFCEFLSMNNLLFFIKPHLTEIPYLKKQLSEIKEIKSRRIIIITDEDIKNKNKILDFYQIMGAFDLLITDYSSVFFDFLLLDKPMIFIPADLEEYRKNRGILLEPYEFWTPGPKVTTQRELQNEILKSLSIPSYYSSERNIIRNITHKFKDGKSTNRVWDFIDSLGG